MTLFTDLWKHRNSKTRHYGRYKINEYCPDCNTQLSVSGLSGVGEGWCEQCRERKDIR